MSPSNPRPDRSLLRTLKGIGELPPYAIDELAAKLELAEVPARRQLFVRGREDTFVVYLIEGTARLEYDGGHAETVTGGSEAARAPLAEGQPRPATATTASPVRVLRVDRNLLEVLGGGDSRDGLAVAEIAASDELVENQLFHRLYHDYMAGTLELPHLPDVAVRVRAAAQDEDSDANTIARIILTDPVLTAKLIQVANSPLYGVQTPITTCKAAVVFLGLETTRNLVLTYTLRELFKTDSALLRQRMTELWRHSALIASICYLVAGMTPGLDRERGMVAGLLHDIGVLPIIHYAARVPQLARDAVQLDAVIRGLRGQMGAMLLRRWKFGDELVQVVLEAEAWQRDLQPHADYADLVVASQLVLGVDGTGTGVEPDAAELPELEAAPAIAKLARGTLDAELAGQLRAEAEADVANTLGLLN